MAMAGPAYCADDCCELGQTPRQRIRLPSLAARLLTIAIIASAMASAGCARNPAQHDLKSAQREVTAAPVCVPARPRIVYTEARRHAEPRIRRPDAALLEPQTAPNCEFRRADIKAVDPDAWARLKTEFERQCYQDAEKAARDRLNQLQAAVQ
jgi:hypothetical protein